MNLNKLFYIIAISLCSLINLNIAIAAPKIINAPINLGPVNGDIINKNITRIHKTLRTPLILNINKSEIKTTIDKLTIKNATLIKSGNKSILIMANQQLITGEHALTKMNLILLLNSVSTPFFATQHDDNIDIKVPHKFKQLALQVEGDMIIELPTKYKGPLNFNIDIEGWSNIQTMNI